MQRFQDAWVVDKVLYNYINQGGCACCGMSYHGMSAQELMMLCSDVNSDEVRKELLSPWPKVMHDEIWADRVKLRRKLKAEIPKYTERFSFSDNCLKNDFDETVRNKDKPSTLADQFAKWWLFVATKAAKNKCFVLPKTDLNELLQYKFEIGAVYGAVICSVLEQVQNFVQVGYPPDSEVNFELYFEACLVYERKAFSVKSEFFATREGNLAFCRFLHHLTTKSNLPKEVVEKRISNPIAKKDSPKTQSFRNDRRLLRLIIFRFFADQAWRMFQRELKEEKVPKMNDSLPES